MTRERNPKWSGISQYLKGALYYYTHKIGETVVERWLVTPTT